MRLFLPALVLLTILLLAPACTVDGADTGAGSSPDPTPTAPANTTSTASADATPTATAAPTPTAVPTAAHEPVTAQQVREGGQRCTGEAWTVAYPDGWEAVAECGQLGPAPLEAPEPGTDQRPGAVAIFVDPVPFGEVAAASPEITDRAITTLDGLRALRLERVEDGRGLYPVGTQTTQWLVDLQRGTDDPARTLFATTVDVRGSEQYRRSTGVLDAMMRTIDLSAGLPEDDQVVARFEGGGAPTTVLAAPAATQPSTCFRTDPGGGGPSCLQRGPITDVVTTGLDGPSDVGYTVGKPVAGDVARIDVTTADGELAFLPVDVVARDDRAFALPLTDIPVEQIQTSPTAASR